MVRKKAAHFRPIRSHEILLLAVCSLLGAASFFVGAGTTDRTAVASSETRFVETSASGLQIVPASCPSSPHSSADCSTNPTTTAGQTGGCTIAASPNAILNGGTGSTLSWYVFNYSVTSGVGVTFVGGGGTGAATISDVAISNVGAVARSGSTSVNPTGNTTYTLSGRYMNGNTQLSTFSCSVGVAVSNCPSGQIVQNNQCVSPPQNATCPTGQHPVGFICICDLTNLPADSNGECNATTQVCPTGFQYDPGSGQCIAIAQCTLPPTCSDSTHVLSQCSGAVTNCVASFGPGWYCQAGACRQPPPPIASISAVPSLVAPNVISNVAWTSTNAASCSVRGSNGDGPWSGTSGSHTTGSITAQTIYTLTCTGLDDSTITRTATINIIPNWVEQ